MTELADKAGGQAKTDEADEQEDMDETLDEEFATLGESDLEDEEDFEGEEERLIKDAGSNQEESSIDSTKTNG